MHTVRLILSLHIPVFTWWYPKAAVRDTFCNTLHVSNSPSLSICIVAACWCLKTKLVNNQMYHRTFSSLHICRLLIVLWYIWLLTIFQYPSDQTIRVEWMQIGYIFEKVKNVTQNNYAQVITETFSKTFWYIFKPWEFLQKDKTTGNQTTIIVYQLPIYGVLKWYYNQSRFCFKTIPTD
jgi:hypothetical protein